MEHRNEEYGRMDEDDAPETPEGYEDPLDEPGEAPRPVPVGAPPVEVPMPAEAETPADEMEGEPAVEPGLPEQVAELRGQMIGVLDRLAAVERDLAAIRRVEVCPPPRILDVSMLPTREEMEGVRGLVEPAGPTIQVPAGAPFSTPSSPSPTRTPAPPPVMTADAAAPPPDETAGAVVRRLLRAAGIPFTQVRVRWEMNERRAAVYLDRDAVMDMLSDPSETGGRFAEIVEWGEAICHALAVTPQGTCVEEMKWFPYSRDDDAWWGTKVLVPHLGL